MRERLALSDATVMLFKSLVFSFSSGKNCVIMISLFPAGLNVRRCGEEALR